MAEGSLTQLKESTKPRFNASKHAQELYCFLCKKNFISRSFHEHCEEKHPNVYCTECKIVFETANALATHAKIHLLKSKTGVNKKSASLQKFDCETCESASGISSHALHMHYKQFHAETYCISCRALFQTTIEYKNHKKSHADNYKYVQLHRSNFDCEKCGLSWPDVASSRAHKISMHGDLLCTICNLFCFKMSLQEHWATRHTDLYCFECQMMLTRKQDWIAHVQETHDSYSALKSDGCVVEKSLCCANGKTTVTENHAHYMKEHKDRYCEICRTLLADSNDLLKHDFVMHGEFKKMPCEICYRSFGKNQLRPHYASQHVDAFCKICKIVFTDVNLLETHLNEFHQLTLDKTKLPPKDQDKRIEQGAGKGPMQSIRFCKICKIVFTDVNLFQAHLNDFHQDTLNKTKLPPKVQGAGKDHMQSISSNHQLGEDSNENSSSSEKHQHGEDSNENSSSSEKHQLGEDINENSSSSENSQLGKESNGDSSSSEDYASGRPKRQRESPFKEASDSSFPDYNGVFGEKWVSKSNCSNYSKETESLDSEHSISSAKKAKMSDSIDTNDGSKPDLKYDFINFSDEKSGSVEITAESFADSEYLSDVIDEESTTVEPGSLIVSESIDIDLNSIKKISDEQRDSFYNLLRRAESEEDDVSPAYPRLRGMSVAVHPRLQPQRRCEQEPPLSGCRPPQKSPSTSTVRKEEKFCTNCNSVYRGSSFRAHCFLKHKSNFCLFCDSLFETSNMRDNHVIRDHNLLVKCEKAKRKK